MLWSYEEPESTHELSVLSVVNHVRRSRRL